jgi:endonuclease-3
MAAAASDKLPFDIDSVLHRIEAAVAHLPKAALFQLYEEGYRSPFEQLIACMISVRTRDEVTVVCARKLFSLARAPAEMAGLEVAAIDQAIGRSTFHEPKAAQIRSIAQEVVDRHGGELPCEFAVLTGFHGVGPKCANLVLGIACGQPAVGVDIHVHRVTNRWGYVEGRSPERTMAALEAKLPARYRVDINRLLVPFGKHICTGVRPRCSTCPVLDMCRQVGVTGHR